MKRGLAFEVPMGPIYSRPHLRSIRKNLNKILGLPATRITGGPKLTSEYFDKRVNNALFNIADEDYMEILLSSSEEHLRQFKIRTGDLMNSYGFAIYLNGQYQRDYVRTVDEDWEPETNKPSADHSKYGNPQNALRRFAREYECTYRQGFSVVFMVGYPYSVDLETGGTPSKKKYAVLFFLAKHFADKLMEVRPHTVTMQPKYIISD